jgi:hypothetical protein
LIDDDTGLTKLSTYTTNDAQHHVIETPSNVPISVAVALQAVSGREEKKRKWKASPIVLSQERKRARTRR